MTRRLSRPAARATDREVGVVAAVLVAGSEKAAAHRLGLSHSTVKHYLANARSKVGATTTAQLVWILEPRLPEPTRSDDRSACRCSRQPQWLANLGGSGPRYLVTSAAKTSGDDPTALRATTQTQG